MLRIMQKHPSALVFLWAATLFKKRENIVRIQRTFFILIKGTYYHNYSLLITHY